MKGVVSEIRKTEEMPTDAYGFTADCCIDPPSVPNRMNPGQLIETWINRVSVFVQRQALELAKTKGIDAAVEHVLGYLRKINPAYADLIVAPKAKANPQFLIDTLAQAEANGEIGIYIMIPPFLKQITPELNIQLHDEYDVKISPVTYYPRDENGVAYKVTTKCDVSIGAKYMYVLYKIPHAKAPGVGYINQFKVPVKPSQHAKLKSLIGQTPLRIGEDETRISTMCAGPEAVTRLMGLHANSFEAVKVVCNTLLRSPHPEAITRINISNEEIAKTNNMIGVSKHLMSTMGINLDNIDCEAFDEAKFTADLQSIHNKPL